MKIISSAIVARWAILAAASFASIGSPTAFANDETASLPQPPRQRRIEAVAAMLPSRPQGFGRPIDDRVAWERIAANAAFKDVVPRAVEELARPMPEMPDNLFLDFSRTGNRLRWRKVSQRRRGRIETFVLAECLENKGRFLPALQETIRDLCAESTWVMPAHDKSLANFHGTRIDIDLGSSSLAWRLATADYLLGDRLQAKARRKIRENVRRRIFEPFRAMTNGHLPANWWIQTTNNWNAVCLAGVTGSALTLIEPREERAFFVVAAENDSKNFLRGFTADGYCSEGLGYWNYGFGHYVLLSEAIVQATGGKVDLLAARGARQPATFGARIEILDGISPAFADCSVHARPDPRIMYFVSRRFGLGLRRWENESPVSPRGTLFESAMYSFPNSTSRATPPSVADATPPERTWFDQGAVLIGRPGKLAACRLGVALKGGHNAEHHNHNDIGSFVVVTGGRPVLLDPGPEVYTARTFSSHRYDSKVLNSHGHPVPVVAGKLQTSGKTARGRIVRTKFTDIEDTLVLDLRSAYRVENLNKLERTFVYSRTGAGSLTITDEVEFSTPKAFAEALITLGDWKRTAPGRLRIQDGKGVLEVGIEVEGSRFDLRSEEIQEDVPGRRRPTRLEIELKNPVTRAIVKLTITPANGN